MEADAIRETPRAARAFTDYLAMGTSRSLDRLAEMYQGKTGDIPTKQISRLKQWSTKYAWQSRIRAMARQDADEIAKAQQEERQRVLNDGLSLDFERVRVLKRVAGLMLAELDRYQSTMDISNRRLQVLVDGIRGLLDDIAREVGGRIQRSEINLKAIRQEAERIADEVGMSPDEVLKLAEELIKRRQQGDNLP